MQEIPVLALAERKHVAGTASWFGAVEEVFLSGARHRHSPATLKPPTPSSVVEVEELGDIFGGMSSKIVALTLT